MWSAQVTSKAVMFDGWSEPVRVDDLSASPDHPWVPALARAASWVIGSPVEILGRPYGLLCEGCSALHWRAVMVGEPDSFGRPVIGTVSVDMVPITLQEPIATPE